MSTRKSSVGRGGNFTLKNLTDIFFLLNQDFLQSIQTMTHFETIITLSTVRHTYNAKQYNLLIVSRYLLNDKISIFVV